MSLSTPILTASWACAAPHSKAAASAASTDLRCITNSPFCSFPMPATRQLNPEVLVQLFEVRVQFRVGEAFDNPAVFHDVITVRDRRGETEILLDQEDGKALLLERANGAADLLDDQRREPVGRLVEQQHTRAGAQDAPDCQHLLLSARGLGALAAQPLLEIGKQRKDFFSGEPARFHDRRQIEVLLDIEARENAALLRTERDAATCDRIRRKSDQFTSFELH